MKKWWVLLFVLVGVSWIFGVGAVPVEAADEPVLVLEPATGSHEVGESWTVELKVDTAGEKVAVADAKLTFDPMLMEVVSVISGDFFDDSARSIDNTKGEVFWGGFFDDVLKTSTATMGTLATITLSAKSAGTASLSFVCVEGGTNESNILNEVDEDVIDCGSLVDGSYVLTGVGKGLTGTGTPTPTSSIGGGGTPTPTPEPPDSGVWEPTVAGLFLGGLLLVIGLAMVF